MSFQSKYLKYKNKYLKLKNQIGGAVCGKCNKEPCNCESRFEDLASDKNSKIFQFLNIAEGRALKAAVPEENRMSINLQTQVKKEYIINIACGDLHSLALLNDMTIRDWGNDDNKQVPFKSISFLEEDKTVVQIAAGSNFSLALLDDGTVRRWKKKIVLIHICIFMIDQNK